MPIRLKRHLDFINESNIIKSASGMNKFGMNPNIEFDSDVTDDIEYAENYFGEKATGPSYPWVPIKALRKGDMFAILLESEDETNQRTVLIDSLTGSRYNNSELNIIESENGNNMDEYNEYELYWFDPESIKENDNLERSLKGMSRFGMFPKEELIKRVEELLSIDPVSINVYDDGDMNIWFMPGSSLKKDIKNDLKDDELINAYYNLKVIGFENQGNDHVYVLYAKGKEVEEEEPATPKEIAQDIVDNSDIPREDLEVLEWELDNYLPNSSFDIDENDHKEIVKHILDIMGYDENEEDEDENY